MVAAGGRAVVVRTRPTHLTRIVRYYPRAAAGDGGMTAAARRWSEAVARLGIQVIMAHDGGKAPDSGAVEWVQIRHVGPPSVRLPVGLEPLLRGADLLVLQSAWTAHNLRAAAVARRMDIPYVLEPRGAYDPHILRRKQRLKSLWLRAGERELIHRAAAIHMFFEAERPHLRALGYDGPAVIVPNGVESPKGSAWDGGSGGYVLWIGRFDPEHKGLDLLLHGLALVPPTRRPNLRLHGPDRRGGRRFLAHLAASLDLAPWVAIGEGVYGDAKESLLRQALGFVYPSRWEAFGNAPAEAAALGVPTLVTPYPLGRYLAERGAAILAEPTPECLAMGLSVFSSDTVADIGARGAHLVREAFGWETVAASWLRQVQPLLR